jgi:hypothetical protein
MPEPNEPSRHLFGRLKQAGAKSPAPNGQADDFNFVATWMKHGWGPSEVEIPQWAVTMWLNRAISKYRAVYGIGTPEMTALFPWAGSGIGGLRENAQAGVTRMGGDGFGSERPFRDVSPIMGHDKPQPILPKVDQQQQADAGTGVMPYSSRDRRGAWRITPVPPAASPLPSARASVPSRLCAAHASSGPF